MNQRKKKDVNGTKKSFTSTCGDGIQFVPLNGRKGYGKVIKPSLTTRLKRFFNHH